METLHRCCLIDGFVTVRHAGAVWALVCTGGEVTLSRVGWPVSETCATQRNHESDSHLGELQYQLNVLANGLVDGDGRWWCGD